jgi:hypothetical protein
MSLLLMQVCSGELTFSKRIGFLETGQDVDQMMYHTGQFMKYTGVVSSYLHRSSAGVAQH